MEDDFIIITVWVDNMLLFTMTFKLKRKAIKDIEDEWEITDLGMPMKIVSIELVISADHISISSNNYINSILQQGLESCNVVTTPLASPVSLELPSSLTMSKDFHFRSPSVGLNEWGDYDSDAVVTDLCTDFSQFNTQKVKALLDEVYPLSPMLGSNSS